MLAGDMDNTLPPGPKPTSRERFNALLAEWGPLLVVVYFSIFALVLVGFALAIKAGFGVEGTAAGTLGTWGAAYVATKLTQPLRIAAAFVITPLLGTLLKRFRRQPQVAPASVPPLDEPSPDSR